jgi:3,2-trans-enoyl-CoA isomerase
MSQNHKYISLETRKNYGIVTIKREPVNSMNLDVWNELLATLDACESHKKIRGVIIQSGVERDVFTAGR